MPRCFSQSYIVFIASPPRGTNPEKGLQTRHGISPSPYRKYGTASGHVNPGNYGISEIQYYGMYKHWPTRRAHKTIPAALAATGTAAFSCLAVFFFPIILMVAARDIMSGGGGTAEGILQVAAISSMAQF